MTMVTGAHPTLCVINNAQRDTYSAHMRIKIPRVAKYSQHAYTEERTISIYIALAIALQSVLVARL